MDASRRGFIRGILASLGLGSLGGGCVFAVPPGWKPSQNANIVLGVISDTHLRTEHGPGGRPDRNWPDKYFAAALEYFKAQNVDAVVHCGDFAHRGQVEEMLFHAQTWERVFPRSLAPDGHKVEKLFVTGNHDVEGASYGSFVAENYPDPDVRAKHVLQTDMAGNWEHIWGEKYEPVWHKEVKGYHFFGRNHSVSNEELMSCLKKWSKALTESKARGRPFFYMQHFRPLGDTRDVLRRLCCGCIPMSFFGHNHWSASNWNVVSLYHGGLPCIQVPSCEPRGCHGLADDAWITSGKLEKTPQVGKGRQGYVVRVYDDMMVIERREFAQGGCLGSNWVMPFGDRTPHPLSRDGLKKVIGEPQFRDGAKLEVKLLSLRGDSESRSSGEKSKLLSKLQNSKTPSGESNGDNVLSIKIPLADGNPKSRVYAYEVKVDGGGAPLLRAVYAAGCNLGMGHEPNGGTTTLVIEKSELPKGENLTISVTPLSSLGTRGDSLKTKGMG